MLIHPQFDPIALSIGFFHIRWYGLMYLLAFMLFYGLGCYRIRKTALAPDWTTKQLEDFLFYGALGVVIGGRLGYIVFYKFSEYLAHPMHIIKIWEGGMSFHGGLLGVIGAIGFFCYKNQRSFWSVADFIAPLAALGLAAGRLGNFINGELWGRISTSDIPWAMVFPQAGDSYPRHPSQLYEMSLEGLLLFAILWVFSKKRRPTGQIAAVFLIGYGLLRFLVEFTREPDYFLSTLAFNLTMGQWLSIPMLISGIALFWYSQRNNHYK